MHEKLEIIHARAKRLQMLADKLITLGKDGSLHSRRQAISLIQLHHNSKDEVVRKLFDVLAKRFATRPGGYTRVLKYRNRKGDNSTISIIEFV